MIQCVSTSVDQSVKYVAISLSARVNAFIPYFFRFVRHILLHTKPSSESKHCFINGQFGRRTHVLFEIVYQGIKHYLNLMDCLGSVAIWCAANKKHREDYLQKIFLKKSYPKNGV